MTEEQIEPSREGAGTAPPSKRAHKLVALVIGCATLLGLAAYFLVTPASPTTVGGPIKVGENRTYGVYVGGSKLGTIKSWIEGMETFDSVDCYVARYSLTIGNSTQAGRMLFDEGGRLRHAKVAFVKEGLKWTTEIGYSPALRVMRVIVEDNRVPENYRVYDNAVITPGETMVPIHPWYLFRVEHLHLGYDRKFFINLLPMASAVLPARVSVVGEERVETLAGSFDCWVLRGENTANLWITKDGSLVTKAIELVGGTTWIYTLESYN